MTNISSPAEKDSRIITINVQKTSQPLGLKLAVCEEKQTVHVADIEKDKITEFCVGDRILHINGKHMSSVKNVMDIIGVVKTGEVIQFDVERSYEFQPNHCKNTHSLTLKKTRKKNNMKKKHNSRLTNSSQYCYVLASSETMSFSKRSLCPWNT